jgi:trimeric autotransporter adhesin
LGGTFTADSVTTGNENTVLGYTAGQRITTGSGNIIVGGEAGINVTTGNGEILIGNSPEGSAESNTIRIGTQGTGTGQQSTAYIAGINGSTVSSGAAVYVDSTGKLGTSGGGTTSNSSAYEIGGTVVLSVPGSADVSLGVGAANASSNAQSTFLGAGAGTITANANWNTFVGFDAGAANTNAQNGTFLGANAGENNTTGQGNTLVGSSAGSNLTMGGSNSIFGNQAGVNLQTGNSDVYIASPGGSATESNTIRIGTPGAQDATFIAGNTVSNGSPVFISPNGMLGLGASGNSGVTSFDGRTGAVVPASGDYSFSLLSGTLASSQLTGTYSDAVRLSNASNGFTGSGAGLTSLNASNLPSGTLPSGVSVGPTPTT